jgi:hypothetical protein
LKYRLEYSIGQSGGPSWEPYGDYPTQAAAQQGARALRQQFGTATRTRIRPVAENAPPIVPRDGAPRQA